jgi:ERCC4-type nuclease
MLRCILEKLYELNLYLHLLFIDFKQAYDTINRTHLYEILKEFGTPKKLVNLSKMTLQDSKGKSNVN